MGSILIEDGVIVAMGEVDTPPDAEVIDGYNHLALPSLVNNHTHLSMVYFRNYGSGYTSLQVALIGVGPEAPQGGESSVPSWG